MTQLEIGQNYKLKTGNGDEWTVVEFTDECVTLTNINDPTKTKDIHIKKTLFKNYNIVKVTPAASTAVVTDGNITEITGTMRSFVCTEDFKNGEMTVEDTDGNVHIIQVNGKTKIRDVLYRHNPSKYLRGMDSFVNATPEEQNIEITAICANNKILVFRTYQKEGKTYLYAPVTTRYKKSKIEDFVEMIQSALGEDVKVETNSSNGFHGGSAYATLISDDIATYKIHVDMGNLDGFSAIKIKGSGMILACSNEMTLDVSKAFQNVPKLNLNTRMIHTGDKIDSFTNNLNEVMSVMEDFSHVLTEAKNIYITPEFTAKILTYYESHGMSKKTRKIVEGLIEDTNVQQVPSTVWGLAMAITYAGTHNKMGKTVEEKLRKIGGELLIVATNWDKYEDIINSKVPDPEPEKLETPVFL